MISDALSGGVIPAAAFGSDPQIGPESVPFDMPIGSFGKFEADKDASQGVDKHRLMRARDVHVYCDNVVAGIATKLHHLSIPLRTGIGAITQWGNHIIQGSVGVREAS